MSTDTTPPTTVHTVIHFPRRMGALLYDTLVLAALWMFATAPLLLLTGGEAVTQGAWGYRLYLLVVAVGFHGWFWTHGGQTLGMRAWRVRLETRESGPVTWRQATIRCAAALLSVAALGLGYLWALVDRERLTWHDRLSGTRTVLISIEEMTAASRS